MRIADTHSHLNGKEWLDVHQPNLWDEIEEAVRDAVQRHSSSHSGPTGGRGGRLRPGDLIQKALLKRGWLPLKASGRLPQQPSAAVQAEKESRVELAETLVHASLIKDRVGVALHFGGPASIACEAFAEHLSLYVGDVIDVGVEILPMKELQSQMSSGVAYYEGELYNVLRQGRGVPAVPLVLLGIAP